MTPAQQRTIEYATKTTGTILVCSTGVYSGDGRRSMTGTSRQSRTASESIRRYLFSRCRPFTAAEVAAAHVRAEHRAARYARLAKRAIDAGKFESAAKLCESAAWAATEATEYATGKRRMYRINAAVEVL